VEQGTPECQNLNSADPDLSLLVHYLYTVSAFFETCLSFPKAKIYVQLQNLYTII